MKLAILFADGCEEIEGLTVVDLARRAGIEIDGISIKEETRIRGSHKISFHADFCMSQVDWEDYDGIILPGGLPGTTNLGADGRVIQLVQDFASAGKLVAAICAAPSVLAKAGILSGKRATSNPGFADKMDDCDYLTDKVVRDGNIITSRAMGTAFAFGLAIVAYVRGEETARGLGEDVLYK